MASFSSFIALVEDLAVDVFFLEAEDEEEEEGFLEDGGFEVEGFYPEGFLSPHKFPKVSETSIIDCLTVP